MYRRKLQSMYKDLRSDVHRINKFKNFACNRSSRVTKCNGAVYRARVTKSQTFTTKIFSHCV